MQHLQSASAAAPSSSPADWTVVEEAYVEQKHQLNETIFCLSNGFLAMRGDFEEGYHGALGSSVPGLCAPLVP